MKEEKNDRIIFKLKKKTVIVKLLVSNDESGNCLISNVVKSTEMTLLKKKSGHSLNYFLNLINTRAITNNNAGNKQK